MSTVLIALIVGAVVGLIVGINQHYRVSNYRNPFVLSNADGSVYGGHFRIMFGVALLWTIIGFVIALPLTALIRWIT